MELKDRIQYIMANEKVNPSTFADYIGVQRSSISHILSGRNKPSLELLQKILLSYPKYSTNWLVLGKGESLETVNTTSTVTNKPASNDHTLFTDVNQVKSENPIAYGKPSILQNKSENAAINTINKALNTSGQQKTISQVIICYSDNTFSAYTPE